MSFLMDALNKQKQNEAGDANRPVFAEDSTQERLHKSIKSGALMVLGLIATFIAGFYLASFLNQSSQQPAENLANKQNQPSKPLITQLADDNAKQTEIEQVPLEHAEKQTESQTKAFMTLSELTMPVIKKEQAKTNHQPKVQSAELDKLASNQANKSSQEKDINGTGDPKNNAQTENSVALEQSQTDFKQLNSIDDENEISADLLAKFNAAVEQTMALSDSEISQQSPSPSQIVKLTELDESFQSQIPSLNFQTHIFSSEANKAWVKVNGNIVKEGDNIAQGLRLRKITPQDVILEYKQKTFSLPALSTW
ncbi:general secretion pathway protein GspB [Catenovulum adriaticum]|uniref:General secretion pathway protein GspB n=1 Tax=Catenovulum adriaticum TaxID=2984846 RepID=A0ABY7AKZ8_9ALTE|nr:general secretion pathway protein GspB [Catenovulum sp. TS8]WAJ69130.1 general secretion pathway protein GspB [Catenovulum sp. TS8]